MIESIHNIVRGGFMKVPVKDNHYDIHIGYQSDNQLVDFLYQFKDSKFLVVTDQTVFDIYQDRLKSLLTGLDAKIFTIASGEGSKSMENFVGINRYLSENNFTRSDTVIAFGGGVVGDLAGFAASAYLRGIRLVAVPTSLLAMVDSSVGGKTGINFRNLKNQIGSFYFPSYVHIDYSFLESLDKRNINNGLAEVFKYAVLSDADFFAYLKEAEKLDFEKIIHQSILTKLAFVKNDVKDKGKRQKLNLGHTIGHGIESISNYDLNHGESIGIGTIYISRASYKMGLCQEDIAQDLVQAFHKYGLPTRYDFDTQELLEAIHHDKKIEGEAINIILPLRMGKVTSQKVSLNRLAEIIGMGKDYG